MDDSNNSSVDKKERHIRNMNEKGRCSHCRPHGGENATHHKHPVRKPRKKDKRRA